MQKDFEIEDCFMREEKKIDKVMAIYKAISETRMEAKSAPSASNSSIAL